MLLTQSLRRILDKLESTPPGGVFFQLKKERDLLSELKKDCCKIPVCETSSVLPSEAEWLSNMNRLRELILGRGNLRNFLRWDVISNTMFVSDAHYIKTELDYLRNLPSWNAYWQPAIKESPAGHPFPSDLYPGSSSNLIHHAYHVATFEEKSQRTVKEDIDFVLEFGGGYGSMCRVFYNLGFHGKYIIFDLPIFTALQKYYLKSLGLPVLSVTEFVKSKTGILCLSDIYQLTELLSDQNEATNRMFLATWSLSESPVSIRKSISPLIVNFQSFLIAYQDRFGEVSNLEFFDNWKETMRDIVWHSWKIEHLTGNSYLVGGTSP